MPTRRRDEEEPEFTAQPKEMSEELESSPEGESGLSVAPEDLGRRFLNDATDQTNFESERGGDNADLWVNDPAPSDEALSGPNFEGDRNIWENTVSLTLQNGSVEGAQEELVPPTSSDEEQEDPQDGLHLVDRTRDLDLTESAVQEASLLDHETGELGETASPELRTEDTRTHAKKRGGHAPKAAARSTPRGR